MENTSTTHQPKREEITTEEQLRRWVAGDSTHRLDPSITGGECCPDFSCCNPQLLAEKSVREAFAAASQNGRTHFLIAFMDALITSLVGKPSGSVDAHVSSGSPRTPQ